MEVGDIVRVRRKPEYVTIGIAGKVGKIIDIISANSAQDNTVCYLSQARIYISMKMKLPL